MLDGLLLEVMCKEELKRTITYDFMYISVVLGFFLAHPVVAGSGHFTVIESMVMTLSGIEVFRIYPEFGIFEMPPNL